VGPKKLVRVNRESVLSESVLTKFNCTMWYPRFKEDVEQIEKVQIRATKLGNTIQDMPYQKRLQILDLPSLV